MSTTDHAIAISSGAGNMAADTTLVITGQLANTGETINWVARVELVKVTG